MAIRKVVIWPDPVLSTVAKDVAEFTPDTKKLIEDMFETMYDASGVGLAAPQVGVSQRILVIDLNPSGSVKGEELSTLTKNGFDGPRAFVNPEIIAREGSIIWEEGCLSVPGYNDEVERSEKVTVKALGADGKPFEKTVTGLYAVAIQHEMDHLNGKVFVEYLSRLKREIVRKKMVKIQKDTDDFYGDKRREEDDVA